MGRKRSFAASIKDSLPHRAIHDVSAWAPISPRPVGMSTPLVIGAWAPFSGLTYAASVALADQPVVSEVIVNDRSEAERGGIRDKVTCRNHFEYWQLRDRRERVRVSRQGAWPRPHAFLFEAEQFELIDRNVVRWSVPWTWPRRDCATNGLSRSTTRRDPVLIKALRSAHAMLDPQPQGSSASAGGSRVLDTGGASLAWRSYRRASRKRSSRGGSRWG